MCCRTLFPNQGNMGAAHFLTALQDYIEKMFVGMVPLVVNILPNPLVANPILEL